MTLAGFLRDLDASSRRSARTEQRSLRQMAVMRVQALKEEIRERAAEVVSTYEHYISMLETIHHDCSVERDWRILAVQADPPEPKPHTMAQKTAKAKFIAFQPSILDRVLFRSASKLAHLEDIYRQAVKREARDFEEHMRIWKKAVADVAHVRAIAGRVLRDDKTVYGEILKEMLPLQDLAAIVTDARMHWDSLECIEITLCIKDAEVIPDYVLSLTKTGKLSEKAMAKKRYWELYQDVVCAAAIRAAREVFALLPFRTVLVHCEATRPSSATGIDETGIALSVRYPRQSFSQLIFGRIDPSDSLRTFEHRMEFKRGEGFRFVKPLPR
jgi:hypothetical protein